MQPDSYLSLFSQRAGNNEGGGSVPGKVNEFLARPHPAPRGRGEALRRFVRVLAIGFAVAVVDIIRKQPFCGRAPVTSILPERGDGFSLSRGRGPG